MLIMRAFWPARFVENPDMLNRLLSVFLLFTSTNCLFGISVDEGIKNLSLDERICLQVFFDQAIKQDQAAHVLFYENKPACLAGPALKHRDKTFKDTLALRGWYAFKKNETLFTHPNFIFTANNVDFGKDCKVLHIYIINRKSLMLCLDNHLDLFKEILGPQFSSKEFITQLEEGQALPSLLNHDEMLMGIVLGYGRESAAAFKEKRTQYTRAFAPPPTETYCRIDLDRPKGCKIHPVVFMGNPHSSEVQELTSLYEEELEEVWVTYKRAKNRLKMVLETLCAED